MMKQDLLCIENKADLSNSWTAYRIKKTIAFVRQFPLKGKNVLCAGYYNEIDKLICATLGIEYEYTNWDLDRVYFINSSKMYDYIFCLDVLEHLMNPLLFLSVMKQFCCPIVITYPHRPFVPFWYPHHFHEYSNKAFNTLLEHSGWKVVKHETFSYYQQWWKFFNGIRPVIKFIFLLFGYPKHEMYVLEIKNE